MLEYTVKLRGPEDRPVQLSATLLAEIFHILDKGSRGAVRLLLDGRSTAKGTQPAWLGRASAVRLEGIEKEHSVLRLSAYPLAESLPAKTPQHELLSEQDAPKSGLTLFSEGLRDALRASENTDTYDNGLLRTFEHFRNVFSQGVVGLELRNGAIGTPSIDIAPEALEVFSELHPRDVEPRFCRVAGKLDVISNSDRAFVVQLPGNGPKVRGVFPESENPAVSRFFGENVVVSGQALFRPSGALLRIDAERIDAAADADLKLWATVPTPLQAELHQRDFYTTQGRRSGVSAAFGHWPRALSREEEQKAFDFFTRKDE